MENRVLFLVATPLSDSLDWVLCKLNTATSSTGQQVNWDSTSEPDSSIPRITDYLSFDKHYAVGVMDRKDWGDSKLTLLEKFTRAHFWEHRGPSSEPRAGGAWDEKDIQSIQSLQFLGGCYKSDEIISKDYSSRLLEKWAYLPVWWNCQSFATRLAFLLVESKDFRHRIASLAADLHVQIVERVISFREETLRTAGNYAGGAAIGTWVCAAVSSVFFPPAAGVFAAGFVGAWCVGAGEAAISDIYHHIDEKRVKQFLVNMKELETRFSSLRDFHIYIPGIP